MFFYIIQLFDERYRDDIVLALTSAGIMKGTYVEGNNLDRVLDSDFPIFTGFFRTRDDKERRSLLFFGTVNKKEKIQSVVDLLKDAGIKNEDDELFRVVLLQGELYR